MADGKILTVRGNGVVRTAISSGKAQAARGEGQVMKASAASSISGALLILNASGVTIFEALSGEPSISALRCIVMRGGSGFVASSDDVSCANAIAGISTTAATSLAASFVIQGSGIIEDNSFAWEDNLPIFCGPDGRLTQTPPTSGFWQIVGTPLSTTKFEINIKDAINF